jgi:hypothetical protein
MELGKYVCIEESRACEDTTGMKEFRINWVIFKKDTEVELVELDNHLSNGVMRVFIHECVRYTLWNKEFDKNFIFVG